jgi:hypothetical protein
LLNIAELWHNPALMDRLDTIRTILGIIAPIITIIANAPKVFEAVSKTWTWFTRFLESLDDVPVQLPSNFVTVQLTGQSISASSGRLLGAVLSIRT